MKAEELKQKAKIPKRGAFDFTPIYTFTEEELKQYADEVGQARYDKGWDDAREHYKSNRFNF